MLDARVGARLLRAAAIAALATVIGGAACADASGPSGRFVVIDLRAASDVAAPAAARSTDGLGREVRFGKSITWTDGRQCTARPAEGTGAAALDRNLSDLQVVPGKTDRRLNRAVVVDCAGSAVGTWEVLQVDDRVMTARSGASTVYLVLEKPLSRVETRRLRSGLRRAGLDPGPADGPIDERTRSAIAAYARQHGAASRFATGVVTRNLLDALSGTR